MKKLTREGRINLWASVCLSVVYAIIYYFVIPLSQASDNPLKATIGVTLIFVIFLGVSLAGIWGGNFAENMWDSFKEKYMEEPETYEDHERHG